MVTSSGMPSLPENFDVYDLSVMQFTEKPDETKARVMLAMGDYSWNSGMFIWRADRILDEFASQMPDLKLALDRIGAAWDTPQQSAVLASEWSRLKVETT